MKRDVIVILGRTGSGKSQWAKIWAKKISPIYIYDPLWSYQGEIDMDGSLIEESELYPQKNDRIIYGDPRLVDYACDVAYERGDCTLLFEECSSIWRKGERVSEPVLRQIFLGRHAAVNLVCVAQRSASIPIDLRSQANRVICFSQFEADDVKWLSDIFGKKNTDEISKLKPFECFDYKDGEIMRYSIRAECERNHFFKNA